MNHMIGSGLADELLLSHAQQCLAQAQQGAGKPARALSAQRQRQEPQKLLNQLEAGQKVNPAEVECVLRQSLQPS
jgi:hypothetical protein